MHRITVAAVAAVLLLTATACGGADEVTTKPNKPAAAAETADPAVEEVTEEPAEPTPSKAEDAAIGDTITLKGFEDGEQLDVTVKKWVDPAKGGDEFFAPEDGNRWVGAQFELVNTGTKVYSDSPSNGAQVADTEGQRFGTTFADITAGPSMTSDAKVPPGEKALGWIVFEVPKGSKVATIQFAMNSGMADQTGQWKVS
ncbi:DUF4352 domain-containing protein [Streptomyces sp. NPDC101062]|uniref:DUF4352 domain-containing protein n=1 Tax=unclassified Streptomyces TaxID=2593676 RepID=UPI002E76121A|nr:DUF4352 domain-containing protein [Streptomyces sp. JV176]MEE1802264.1 DUF4352 domain-containing protein [Streptomyces sp. JV176]